MAKIIKVELEVELPDDFDYSDLVMRESVYEWLSYEYGAKPDMKMSNPFSEHGDPETVFDSLIINW